MSLRWGQLIFGTASSVIASFLLTPVDVVYGQEASTTRALEEIVVTARRREESLMETPVSITALTSDELVGRQIEQAHQIAEATPNLVFYNTSIGSGTNIAATIFIRGIGQADYVPTVQTGVGTYIDGAYISNVTGALTDMLDIESIEVLRGPQGTLFGRNTIGGAILITSKKPTEEFAAELDLTAGEFSRQQVKASVNIPFTDKFYGKFSVLDRQRDGWVHTPNIPDDDGLGSDDTWAARAALRWLPTDALTIDLTTDFTHHESDGVTRVAGAVNPASGNIAQYNNIVAPALGWPLYTSADVVVPLDSYTSLVSKLVRADADILGVSLAVEWNIGDLTFNSYTTYRDQESIDGSDQDHSPLLVSENFGTFDGDQFSQEFHLSGVAADGRLPWLVGLYYFEEDLFNQNPIRFPFFALMSGAIIDNQSSAVFGQLTYDLTEKWSLTVGGRYTEEKFDSIVDDRHQFVTALFDPTCTGACAQPTLDGFFPAVEGYRILPLPPDPSAFRIQPPNVFEIDETEFEPYVNLAYNFTDNLMGYVSYSEGFKGGGFTQRIPPGRTVQAFQPEFAEVYEIGAKWSGDRINVSTSMFFTDYTDLQVPVSQELGSGIENASDAEIKGFEIEVLASVTPRLQLSGGVGHLDGEYKNVRPEVQFSATNRLPSVMDWQTNASIVYRVPIPAISGQLVARLDHLYVDDHFTGARNEPGTLIESYSVYNGGVTYINDSDNWEIAVQGRNITDELYHPQIDGNLQANGFLNVFLAPPSEWSASFRYRF